MAYDPQNLTYDLENYLRARQMKALFAGDEYVGQPTLVVTEEGVSIAGDADNVIHVDPEFGVQLAGKLSFTATPDQISIAGGYWRLNPLLLTCIPSTTPTPIPVLVKSTPEILQASDGVGGILDYLTANSDIGS